MVIPTTNHLNPNLNVKDVVVVRVGNVAMDVARILAHTIEELQHTDIADHAPVVLAQSKVENMFYNSAAAWTCTGEVYPGGTQRVWRACHCRANGSCPQNWRSTRSAHSWWQTTRKCSATWRHCAPLSKPSLKAKLGEFISAFYSRQSKLSAEEVREGGMSTVKVEKNKLVPNADGSDMKATGTGEFETIPAGLFLRSVGYKGLPLDSVPYDSRSGTIPDREGRIVDESGSPLSGLYVVGWAKRGANGIIGTNKPDSHETVDKLIEDIHLFAEVAEPDPQAIVELLQQRGVRYVSQADWQDQRCGSGAWQRTRPPPRQVYFA